MADAALQSLIAAARRRVWRGELVTAVRWASWGTVALTLLAATIHLTLRPVTVGVLAAALAVLWTALLARAGLRRPSDAASALWADRYAGGASAYSTWREMRGAAAAAPTPAFAWLERWAEAKVPESLRLLGDRRIPVRLARPLAAVAVCAAFATVVLTLPGFAPSAAPAAPVARSVAEQAPPGTPPSSAAPLVDDLANALRAADSRRPSGARTRDSTRAAEPGRAGTANELAQAPSGAVTRDGRAASGQAANAEAGAPGAGATAGSGAASGRSAGDSADNRTDTGSSRPARGTMPLQTQESTARASRSLRADPSEPAAFDEDSRAPQAASARANRAPPAAPPPATTETAELTTTQAAYVQAWMKAIGPRH